jgi:hypothetical protein
MMRTSTWGKRGFLVLAISAITAAGLASGAASKTTVPNGTFKGKSSNGFAVTFKVKNGKVTAFNVSAIPLCMSVLAPGPGKFDILHFITPPPMKLSAGGKFSGGYKLSTSSTTAKVDGKVSGKSASGHYSLSYSKMGGVTSLGVMIFYACMDKGTWKATKR